MIRKVKQMPDMPQPYAMRNWKQVATAYDRLVFDAEATGDFFPLVWRDDTPGGTGKPAFGLPSYLGGRRGENGHEAINTATAVLGATLCGIDKSNQNGVNWVEMLECYYGGEQAAPLFLNRRNGRAGSTFWYEIYPHALMYALTDLYPDTGNLDMMMRSTADQWLDACNKLTGEDGVPDFDHLSFDFDTGKPVDNGRWREPDAAAGVAWLLYMAYKRWNDSGYLDGARRCLAFLERRSANPFYEVLLPFGACVAARMNAELGDAHSVGKLVNWVFDGDSECRPGWGVIADNWGGCDCYGLAGSITDWGQRWDAEGAGPWKPFDGERSGYAFTANTFALAWPLVPLVRYDSRFAPDIGKWMLNAANGARLFYPGAHSGKAQSCAFYKPDADDVIAYEGLRKWWDHQSPYATGDPIRYSWGAIDLGLYGSSHVGIFGGMIEQTDVEGILRLDCLRTDFFREAAHPTYLYYNPHNEEQSVTIDGSGSDFGAVYDAYAHSPATLRNGKLIIPARSAVLAVLLPEGADVAESDGKRYCNGIVIDYNTRA
jgi:hypothetical protein